MTKRIFAVVIAIAMVCTMFAFVTSAAAETTRVTLDSSVTAHGYPQIINAINFNDYDKDEDGWKQVPETQNLLAILKYGMGLEGWTTGAEEPWNTALYLNCKVSSLIAEGIAWNGEAPAADVLVCDYMQNTFGYAAYALRGGKQRAVDLWNSLCDLPVALDGDYAYTYTNNTKYTSESYNAALNALKAYMVQAQDNYVCNTDTNGRWTKQKARYAALETALQALVEGTPDTPVVVTTTTKTLNTANNYTFNGYLQVVNVIPDTDNTGLRADGTPYKVFLTELLAIMHDPSAGAASDAAYMNSYAMSDGTLLKDYVQDTFGAYAYVLRGGRQKAADYWNSKLSVALTLGDNSYTYTNADKQDAYDATAYQAAVDALNAYMANTADASCFDVANGGGRYYDQKAKYEALVAAVDACAATRILVDFTGVTTPDGTLTYLITMYNNVDVESIKADADVQNWAKAIKEGIAAGLDSSSINVGSTNVVTLWEENIRHRVFLSAGTIDAADAVMLDNSIWPLKTAITDKNQFVYKASQYDEVYKLWEEIRDKYKLSTTMKTSEVLAACERLKTMIQSLEVANLPFTQEQRDAYSVLKTYVPYYRARVERIVLDSNKATDIYKNYVALVVKAEGYLALDWENGTSASYPSVEEMHALIEPGANGGSLEWDWYPFRRAFGLDTDGYDVLLGNTYNAWVESGKYTEASLADVKARIDNFEAANLSGNRGSNNTDAGAQEDIEYYQAFLVEKPALPVFKIASANLLITDSISINFKVNKNVYEGYNNVYAVIECNGETVTITNPTYHEEDNQRYYFTFSGIGPQMMKDDVNITLYGTANGEEYTNSVSYSVYRFCTRQIANNTSDAAYCKVLTDLLNYGAAAQVYVGYKTDDLANAGIDQSYASDTLAEPVSQLNLTYATIENPIVAWKSAALYFESRVSPRLQIQADDITGLYVKFVIDGVEYVVDTFEPREGYTDRYYVTFEGVSPTMMRSAFTATVYKDGVAVSNTLQYSIQTYVVGKTVSDGGINDLLIAMLKFGDSCAAYGN